MSSRDFRGFDRFRRGMRPAMNPATTLQGEHWRIGVITESLIRLEWSDSGVFEDNASLMAVDRAFAAAGTVEFSVGERDGLLVVETPALRLTYDRGPFCKEGLSIVVKGVSDTQFNTWHYGDMDRGNLGGTARTLDEANGAIPLGPGVISRDGWAVLDDSSSNVFVPVDGDPSDDTAPYGGIGIAPRSHAETDIYFFGYGRRYREAVHDFQRLSGPAPLLPRWALGNWWSRYYRYSADEYIELMERFSREGIPFTTAVIDMDWHITDVDPRYGSGWTGYTWNRDLFPDPAGFLSELHDYGMHATLNVHPRDGVRAFEEQYPQVGEAVGADVAAGEPVEFDLTNPRFVKAYFDMHHRLEDDGVDFWWLDWQQGGVTRQPGLDPLWALNHMHYCDSARGGRWPLTFSRFAGPGSQRYPIGFSGDTVVTWESLKFQPYFTATASNIGYGWWSHDIGGHMFGYRDEELEARWYQLGVFSPINRLHSTNSPFNGKEPWNFHEPVRSVMVRSLRLRQALLPYLHSMNWRAAVDGDPIVEPMYWDHPNDGEAYSVPDEFWFGSELVAAPIVEPIDKEAQRAKADVWLPNGWWFDFFDGRRYRCVDGRRMEVWRGIDRMPVFAKAGAIVPMMAVGDDNDTDNPQMVDLVVFPGADGRFVLHEDGGSYEDVCTGESSETLLEWHWGDGSPDGDGDAVDTASLTIHELEGDEFLSRIPENRVWRVLLRGVAPLGEMDPDAADSDILVSVDDTPLSGEASVSYDERTLTLQVQLSAQYVGATVTIAFPHGLRMADDPARADAFDVLYDAQMPYLTKDKAHAIVERLGPAQALNALRSLEHDGPDAGMMRSHMPDSVIGALSEVLTRC